MTDECVSKDNNNNNNNFDHSHHHHDEDVVFCVLMSIHKLVGIKIILDHSLCELLLLWFLYHSIHLLTSKRLWTVLDPDLAAPAEWRADCWGGAEEKNLYVLNQLTLFYIQRMNSSSILEIKFFFSSFKKWFIQCQSSKQNKSSSVLLHYTTKWPFNLSRFIFFFQWFKYRTEAVFSTFGSVRLSTEH